MQAMLAASRNSPYPAATAASTSWNAVVAWTAPAVAVAERSSPFPAKAMPATVGMAATSRTTASKCLRFMVDSSQAQK